MFSVRSSSCRMIFPIIIGMQYMHRAMLLCYTHCGHVVLVNSSSNNNIFLAWTRNSQYLQPIHWIAVKKRLVTFCPQEHMKKIDPEDYLCLGAHSIQGVQTGVVVLSPGLISLIIICYVLIKQFLLTARSILA